MATRHLLVSLALRLASAPVSATSFYVDSATGVSQFRSGASLFTTSTGVPTSFGLAFGLGVFFGTGNGQDPVDFQIGIQPRLSSSSDPLGSYSLLSAYPVIRIQLSRLYFGAGYAPFVYKREAASAGFDGFALIPAGRNLMAEVGALFPVTPDFSIALGGTLQLLRSAAGLSPKTIDYLFSMRFYFGHRGSGGGGGASRSSNEFKGWRYPFGFMR